MSEQGGGGAAGDGMGGGGGCGYCPVAELEAEIEQLREEVQRLKQAIEQARQACLTVIAQTEEILSQPSGVKRGNWAYHRGQNWAAKTILAYLMAQ